jgi:nicotinamidase-related amidase
MTITTLDPKTAVIVIDLVKGILSYPTVHPVDGVLARAAALVAAFRRHGLPVVLVNVTGRPPGRTEQSGSSGTLPADWAEFVPELDRQSTDHVVTKQSWGAFTNTDLEAYLRQLGVTQVVILGVATSIGVESTARFAHELGFNVTLAIDAMTDTSAEAHAHSVERIFPRLGETGAARDIIDLLMR